MKKQTEGAYNKVEESLFNKLRSEVNKPERKDSEFSTSFIEQTKDFARMRLNLDKYLNGIGMQLKNFENSLEKLVNSLDKINSIGDILRNISKGSSEMIRFSVFLYL